MDLRTRTEAIRQTTGATTQPAQPRAARHKIKPHGAGAGQNIFFGGHPEVANVAEVARNGSETAESQTATGWCQFCRDWQPRSAAGVLSDHCPVHWHRWARAVPLKRRAET